MNVRFGVVLLVAAFGVGVALAEYETQDWDDPRDDRSQSLFLRRFERSPTHLPDPYEGIRPRPGPPRTEIPKPSMPRIRREAAEIDEEPATRYVRAVEYPVPSQADSYLSPYRPLPRDESLPIRLRIKRRTGEFSGSSTSRSDDGRTSWTTSGSRNRQGEERASVDFSHRLDNDRTSLYGQMTGSNRGTFGGTAGINHDLSDRTSLNAETYGTNQGNFGGSVGMNHDINDRTSVNARALSNNYGDFEGRAGVTHRLDDRTSLNAGTYGTNRGEFGGSVGVEHKVNEHASVGAGMSANNRGEGRVEVGTKIEW